MNYILFELLSALCTGIIFIVLGLKYHIFYIIGILLYWGFYITYRYYSTNNIIKQWGIYNSTSIYKSFIYTSILSLGLCLILYQYIHSFYLTNNLFISIIIYPLWGIIQQFLLQSMILSNIIKLYKITNAITIQIIIIGLSFLFGIMHKHIPALIIPTTLWGYISSNLYVKFHNIIPIGIYQGILAIILFYGVLHIDVLNKIF